MFIMALLCCTYYTIHAHAFIRKCPTNFLAYLLLRNVSSIQNVLKYCAVLFLTILNYLNPNHTELN